MERPLPKPILGSILAGLVASVCYGGQLILASMGLGALYGALGLSRYAPQAIGLGAPSILAMIGANRRRFEPCRQARTSISNCLG